MGERRDLARRATQPMIGHRASQRETVLDHVEPVHRVLRFAHAAPRSESARLKPDRLRRNPGNRCRARERHRPVRNAERGAVFSPKLICVAKLCASAQERIVNAPAHLRESFLQVRRANVRASANAFPRPETRGRRRHRPRSSYADRARYFSKRPRDQFGFAFACTKRLRARRIVKIENRSLREGIGGAAARGMERIAFDLDRPAIERRDNERHRAVAPRHRGRVKERLARESPTPRFS